MRQRHILVQQDMNVFLEPLIETENFHASLSLTVSNRLIRDVDF